MKKSDRCDRSRPEHVRAGAGARAVRSTPGRRLRDAGTGTGRPVLTLVRGGSGADPENVELSLLTRSPMPVDVRGALVTPIRGGGLRATWMPLNGPSRIPEGRVLLSWSPAGGGRTDVTAHLGLAGAQVLLAVWPDLRGDWSGVVRPTVTEVTELHTAFRISLVALECLAD